LHARLAPRLRLGVRLRRGHHRSWRSGRARPPPCTQMLLPLPFFAEWRKGKEESLPAKNGPARLARLALQLPRSRRNIYSSLSLAGCGSRGASFSLCKSLPRVARTSVPSFYVRKKQQRKSSSPGASFCAGCSSPLPIPFRCHSPAPIGGVDARATLI